MEVKRKAPRINVDKGSSAAAEAAAPEAPRDAAAPDALAEKSGIDLESLLSLSKACTSLEWCHTLCDVCLECDESNYCG